MERYALQWFVEHAPTGSWRISWFAKLSKGDVSCHICPLCSAMAGVHNASQPFLLTCGAPRTCHTKQIMQASAHTVSTCAGKLRKTILAFYAQTSDHVKRLSSPVANGKFSSISADTDTPWGRPEALRSVVTDLKVRSVWARPRGHQPSMHCCCMQIPNYEARAFLTCS